MSFADLERGEGGGYRRGGGNNPNPRGDNNGNEAAFTSVFMAG